MALFRHAIFVAGLGLACFSPVSAEARCRLIGNPIFYVTKGVGADIAMQTDNGRCYLNYVSYGTTAFTSARIVSEPKNGRIEQKERFGFQYTSKKGFRGHDKLSIELCGEGMTGKGCGILSYDINFPAS
jgi:hypothetical protein